jgi:hypothetical protein
VGIAGEDEGDDSFRHGAGELGKERAAEPASRRYHVLYRKKNDWMRWKKSLGCTTVE